MPIWQNNNGTWRQVGPGAIFIDQRARKLEQVFVNAGGIFRPVWKLEAFRAAVFAFAIDDSGYGRINFRTGISTLFLNNDRRSFTYNSTIGRNNQAWAPGLRGTGWENYGNYVNASVYNPTLELKQYELSMMKRCTVRIVGNGRNGPYIQQQPSATNDWTVQWRVNDPQNGPGSYDVGVFVEV